MERDLREIKKKIDWEREAEEEWRIEAKEIGSREERKVRGSKRKFGLKRKSEQKCECNWLNKEVQRSEPLRNCSHYNAMKFTVVLSFTVSHRIANKLIYN